MDFDSKLACKCAEAFSLSTGLGCLVSTDSGEKLFSCGPSCVSCRLCRAADRDSANCTSTQLFGLHQAERFGGKYIYFCAMGLTCFTSPILGPHGSAAQLTVGPFLMVDEQDYLDYDLAFALRLEQGTIDALRPIVQDIPHVDAAQVTALSELLFMAVGFINNVSECNQLLERDQSTLQQGKISAYIHELKRSGAPAPYPFRTEQNLLRAISRHDATEASRLLNELLGHILFSSGGDLARIRNQIDELLTMMSRTAANAGVKAGVIEGIVSQYRLEQNGKADFDALCMGITNAMHRFHEAIFSDESCRQRDTIHCAIRYIQANYSKKLTLQSIAQELSISQCYLSRQFKKELGVSLTQFINHLRIEKSKQLLVETNLPLAEVAQQCGFEDQSYYTKVFGRLCAMTPLKYRRDQSAR